VSSPPRHSQGAALVREAYEGERPSSSGARSSVRRRPLVATGTSGRNVSPATLGDRAALRGNRAAAAAPRPDYVRRCPYSGGADRRAPLMLHVWPKGQPEHACRSVALCGSWRCPSCRRWRASTDYARITEALSTVDPAHVVFVVLTLDRDGWRTGDAWADAETAYRALSRMSRALLKRWGRMLGKPIGSRWVGTVEAHRSGWPHLNLVLVSAELAAVLGRQANAADATDRQKALLRGELLSAALGAGWGPQSTAEVARSPEALAGYLVKLAGELDEAWGAMAGEVTKVTQVPLSAPKGTRRLRSGRKFLPPRRRNPLLTGALLLRSDTPHGASVREYGRRGQSPPPWAAALTRLKAIRRAEALAVVLSAEHASTYLPLPRVVATTGTDRSTKRDGPDEARGPP
jgi:hypothetical protein